MKEINRKFTKEIDNKSKIVAGFIYIIRKILSLMILRTILGKYTLFKFYKITEQSRL